MADDELPTQYTLTTADGDTLESSWDFTGLKNNWQSHQHRIEIHDFHENFTQNFDFVLGTGKAAYINGDTYEGQLKKNRIEIHDFR